MVISRVANAFVAPELRHGVGPARIARDDRPQKKPAWPSRFPGRYLDYWLAGFGDDERLSPGRAIKQLRQEGFGFVVTVSIAGFSLGAIGPVYQRSYGKGSFWSFERRRR